MKNKFFTAFTASFFAVSLFLIAILFLSSCTLSVKQNALTPDYRRVVRQEKLNEFEVNAVIDNASSNNTAYDNNSFAQLLDNVTAFQRLIDEGCPYVKLEKGTCIELDKNIWIVKNNICGATCEINAITGKIIKIDKNPMCTGLLIADECKTDADCSSRIGACAKSYKCEKTSCVPVFE